MGRGHVTAETKLVPGRRRQALNALGDLDGAALPPDSRVVDGGPKPGPGGAPAKLEPVGQVLAALPADHGMQGGLGRGDLGGVLRIGGAG